MKKRSSLHICLFRPPCDATNIARILLCLQEPSFALAVELEPSSARRLLVQIFPPKCVALVYSKRTCKSLDVQRLRCPLLNLNEPESEKVAVCMRPLFAMM